MNFSTDFRKISKTSNFKKIRPVGAELFHADGQTDMTKLTVAFRNLRMGPKNVRIQSSNLHRSIWPLKAKWYHLLTPSNVQTCNGSGGWANSLSPRRPVFYSRRVHAGFRVDKMVGQVYFQALQLSFSKYHSTNALYSFTPPSPTLHNQVIRSVNSPRYMGQQTLMGQGLIIIEASQSHSDTPNSVGLLWTSDQPDAKTSLWQHQHSQDADIHAPGGNRSPQSQQASGCKPTS